MARKTTTEAEYKRLRELLNPAIRGPNTDAVLYALAQGTAAYLVNNVEAAHDQMYIATAVERYLDQRLADFNLVRPPSVGLGDDVFREIGINVVNRKQVRDLVMKLLEAMFGTEATRATSKSSTLEPYSLSDGDQLIVQFDGGETSYITFEAAQFQNIYAATAQEVADAITRSLRKQGKVGSAFSKDDGNGPYVVLISNTLGPSSSVTVRGGRAQNVLRFPHPKPTSANLSTQWTISPVSGGSLRFTWTGGGDPSLGKVSVGDYANIYGAAFSSGNKGTFTVTAAKGGTVTNSYFEVANPNGISQTTVQGTNDAVLFFDPARQTLNNKTRYAAAYQSESRLLQVFIPATTKVVRRARIGAAHIHGPLNIVTETYDPGKNQITDVTCPAKASIVDGSYFLFNSTSGAYAVYFDTTGTNSVIPSVPGRTNVRVNLALSPSSTQVAQALALALDALPSVAVQTPTTSTVKIVNEVVGAVTAASNVSVSGLNVSIYQTGVNSSTTTTSVPDPNEGQPDTYGPYIYDKTQPFVVSDESTVSTVQFSPSTGRVLSVANSSGIPDEQGYIMIGYGTSNQEGPVPYLARPSSNSILLNPSYRIKNIHPIGTDVSYIQSNSPVIVGQDGSNYPFYLTDVVAGRIYAEELINTVVATGIRVVITVLYPSDEGLGRWSTDNSDKYTVWGE